MCTFEEFTSSHGDQIHTEVFQVVDTAYLAKLWLNQHCEGLYTAADVLKLAAMILEQEG